MLWKSRGLQILLTDKYSLSAFLFKHTGWGAHVGDVQQQGRSRPAARTVLADNVHPDVHSWFPPTLTSAEALHFPSATHTGHRTSPLLLLPAVGWAVEYSKGFFGFRREESTLKTVDCDRGAHVSVIPASEVELLCTWVCFCFVLLFGFLCIWLNERFGMYSFENLFDSYFWYFFFSLSTLS